MTLKGHDRLFVALLASLLISIVGCAPPVEKKTWDIVWPLPPDEPRVRFIDILQSNLDVEEQGGFSKALFGEEVVQGLSKPYGVAVDKAGRVYVTDLGRVFVFDKANKKLSFIGAEAGTGKLRIPIGIAVSSSQQRVYVTDTASDKVYVYSLEGKFLTAFGQKEEFESPSGLAIDEKRGRFFIADARKHNVRAYDFRGGLLFTIGGRGEDVGQFNYPTNLALDSSGNLYVVDTGNFRIQVFNHEGKPVRTFGSIGDRPGNFARPKGIAIDSEDNVYIVDAAFQNFQIFNKEGRVLLFVGDGGRNPGQFSIPAGIAVDGQDRIYVVDQLNSRVQIFQYMNEKWKAREVVK